MPSADSQGEQQDAQAAVGHETAMFKLASGQDQDFTVMRFRGTEGLCQLYRFEIELESTLAGIDVAAAVGDSAALSFHDGQNTRFFHGVVSRFEIVEQTEQTSFYRAELVPQFWLLTQRYRSRIFENMSVRDIISAVLSEANVLGEFSATDRPAREYCVQYRETEFNFICRLCEEEGVWWQIENTDQEHKVVFKDAVAGAPDVGGLDYIPPSGLHTTAATAWISRFRVGNAVRPDTYGSTDYNYTTPGNDLNVEIQSEAVKGLDIRDYPGRHATEADGQYYAERRLQELNVDRRLGTGAANTCLLAPGVNFSLFAHPNGAANGDYFVTTVTHQGRQASATASTGSVLDPATRSKIHQAMSSDNAEVSSLAAALFRIASRVGAGDPSAHRSLTRWLYHAGQVSHDLGSIASVSGGSPFDGLSIDNLIDDVARGDWLNLDAPTYECQFMCIPKGVEYRPARVTPWPVMRGSQTGRVVDNVDPDQLRRIRVQFFWAGSAASCWVRVAQPFAGNDYGVNFLPRVGHEVVVDFLEGNPDKPLVIGSVYNGDLAPPNNEAGEQAHTSIKTRSVNGEGFNEIRFEDDSGSEKVFLHAQADLERRVLRDSKTWITQDDHTVIERHQKTEIAEDRHLVVNGDQKRQVEGDAHDTVNGAHHSFVKGNCDLTVDAAVNQKVKQDWSLDTAANMYVKTSANVGIEAGAGIHIKASAPIVIESSAGVCLKSGGATLTLAGGIAALVGNPVLINSGGPTLSGSGVSPGAPAAADAPEAPEKPGEGTVEDDTTYEALTVVTPQAIALQTAAATGAPFCEQCAAAAAEEGAGQSGQGAQSSQAGQPDQQSAGSASTSSAAGATSQAPQTEPQTVGAAGAVVSPRDSALGYSELPQATPEEVWPNPAQASLAARRGTNEDDADDTAS